MKSLLCAAAAVALVATSGCAPLVTGGPLIEYQEPSGAKGATGVMEIRNESPNVNIDSVLISSCSTSNRGVNRLPSGASIPPGGSHRFTLSSGCWEVGAREILKRDEWTRDPVKVYVRYGRTEIVRSR